MKSENILSKKINLSLLFIFLLYIHNINSYDTSSFKINYFVNSNNLYYVNAINNENGDTYIEYWGENGTLYLIGISGERGEELNFGDSKEKKININSNSLYHESIIINYNNSEYILSINYKTFDFININTGEFISKETKNIFSEDQGEPTYRNSIIKLKNNSYFVSMIIFVYGIIRNSHEILIKTFSFSPNNLNEIKYYHDGIDFINSTNCFQTESQYVQCSYNRYWATSDYLTIGIFDYQELDEKKYYDLDSIQDIAFTKIFHIKNEIGAYIYFQKDTNYPKIQIKKLDTYELKLNDVFDPIVLNSNGKYTLNNGLFYSDGIKINDYKIAVILTSDNLLNLLICILDLYNNDKSLRLRYFYLPLQQINIIIGVNIRALKVGNFFGLVLFNSNSNYPGYTLFNFPNFKNDNDYINNTSKEIEIFIDSSSYSFSFEENIYLANDIFGEEIDKIKVINFEDKSNSGVIIKSLNLESEISINDELELNDTLIFEPNILGAFPGKYNIELLLILKELDYNEADSLADETKYYGDTTAYYQSITFTGNIFKLIYEVKCYEKCKSCTQLGSESFYYCIECIDTFPLNFNEGEKCICENYTNIDENLEEYCTDECDNYIYIKYEYKKYCLSSCLFDNEELYSDEENKKCYISCSDNINGNIFSYLKTCVNQCPTNYTSNLNNICILDEIKENLSESSRFEYITDIDSIDGTEIESTIDSKNIENETQLIDNFNSDKISSLNEDNSDSILYEFNSEKMSSLIKNFTADNSRLKTEQINNDTIITCYSSETFKYFN